MDTASKGPCLAQNLKFDNSKGFLCDRLSSIFCCLSCLIYTKNCNDTQWEIDDDNNNKRTKLNFKFILRLEPHFIRQPNRYNIGNVKCFFLIVNRLHRYRTWKDFKLGYLTLFLTENHFSSVFVLNLRFKVIFSGILNLRGP